MRKDIFFGVSLCVACDSSKDDSTNSGSDQSEITCSWTSPSEDTVYEPDDATFEVGVFGASEGASVIWSSSIDGPLGESIVAGEQSSIIVENLSSGTHEITAAATDGDESCEVRVSLSFGLAPQIAFLSPSNGETFGSLSDLNATVQVSDPDESMDSLSINWSVDGSAFSEQAPDLDGLATVELELTAGAHTLTAEVVDGLGLTAEASLTLTINGAPSAPTLELTPNPAGTLDDLVVSLEQVSDPEDDSLLEVYEWLKDGELTAFETLELPAEETAKGETWTFRYTVSDEYSSQVATDSVTIDNTPPTLSDVIIMPGTAVNSVSILTCSYTWDDPDETPDLTVLWRNETLSADLGSEDTLSLSPSLVSPGDTVSCTVTVTDSDGETASLSDSVEVLNSPPIISNIQVSSNGSDVTNDSLLICEASISDPEGTPLTTTYEWTNISQAQSIGQGASLQLSASTASPNDYLRCEISATDANGDTSNATAVVQVINRAPEVSVTVSPGLTVLEGDLVSCSGSVNDPDNDTISSQSISWTNQSTGLVVSLQEDYLVDSSDVGSNLECLFEATDAHGETATASAVVVVSFGNVYTIDGTSETWTEGIYDYDGLTLINGATLNIEGNVILNILGVLSVDTTSLINGDGGGHAPNPSSGTGNGPCPGEWASVEAASGGGYGGLGGEGGTDSASSIAIGGCTTGSSDSFAIEKGSSGGSSDNNSGGAGGASIHVNAVEIVIDGEISMNGDDGECCSGRNGGGGAGGGILLSADVIEISGVLSANGGFGGDGATSSADGGGGGGGGRIKIFTTQSLTFTGAYTVDGGLGGIYGGYQQGQDGEAGTYHQN